MNNATTFTALANTFTNAPATETELRATLEVAFDKSQVDTRQMRELESIIDERFEG